MDGLQHPFDRPTVRRTGSGTIHSAADFEHMGRVHAERLRRSSPYISERSSPVRAARAGRAVRILRGIVRIFA